MLEYFTDTFPRQTQGLHLITWWVGYTSNHEKPSFKIENTRDKYNKYIFIVIREPMDDDHKKSESERNGNKKRKNMKVIRKKILKNWEAYILYWTVKKSLKDVIHPFHLGSYQ